MLAAGASSANEYAKEKKKMTFSTKCYKALLKYKRDHLLNNMLVQLYIKGCLISRECFIKVDLKVGFR